DHRRDVGLLDHQLAVAGGDGTPAGHEDRARRQGDLDIVAVKLHRADGVSHGRNAPSRIEARAVDLKTAGHFLSGKRNAVSCAPGFYAILHIAIENLAPEQIFKHPTTRSAGRKPRPKLLHL